ncbi:hypothetical protein M409DRAFT_62683 [Zasmidium cellare ATCC 36951]|uniref:Gag1-like clamp domain-containing protein n=1 Tax=Zasmidium cellare ATCC 36951 TaxID=1080233 RepID=A0A6A6D4L3_ZASCE|nr:uncharacterized protein M409DRAFT_62683 [Zasmidium cellare ATCC 36951]KAF2173059.1 hypothetical protein M409DRAFT_62683 [Zasmidium cellare ATCC 36951]
MTLHLNFPHHRHHHASSSSNATEQAHEVREARRFLKERVRNDWEYPTLPAWRSSGSTYKFEAPDSVGTQLSERRVKKKRKRFVALEREMEWNDGLAHWMRRRDACPSTTPDLAAISTTTSTPTTTTQIILSPTELLLPIAPPLLPNHPVRRKITPNMYPEIYTKIILQSRTPSVPINLRTLVHALVQGWKTDGEWPPKAAPLEKSIGRKRGSHSSGLREGVKAVGRVLRLTGTGTGEVGRGES